MTGAAIAAGATSAIGLKRGKDAGDAAAASAEAGSAQASELNRILSKMGEQGVEFAQGQMDDWESTFGGVQENLSSYYDNLDPTKFATQQKQGYQQQMDKSMKQYNDTMASSGLQTSGMKAQTAKEAAFKQAEGNAAIDIGSEEQVRQMQQGFVNSGEGQRNSANNMMQGAMGNQAQYANIGMGGMMDASNKQTQQYSGSQQGYMGMAGTMMGSAIGLGINAGGGQSAPRADVNLGNNPTNPSGYGPTQNMGRV